MFQEEVIPVVECGVDPKSDLFGNNQNASTSSGLFGNNQNASTSSGLFGNNQNASPSSGLFGSTTTSAFGQTKPAFRDFGTTQTSSLFGQQDTAQAQPQTSSIFGRTVATTTSGLFGFSGGFSNTMTATANTGTGAAKFEAVPGTDTGVENGVSQTISTLYHCITCMKEYEAKSLEELRLEDYTSNRKGPQQGVQLSGGLFESTAQPSLFGSTAQPSLFGSTSQPSLFGAGESMSMATDTGFFGKTENKPLFGNTSTAIGFGQTSNVFGSAGNSIFGKPAAATPAFGTPTTTNASTFAFNLNQATNTNPFGSNMAQVKPFGSKPTNTFGFPFGTTPTNTNTAIRDATTFGTANQNTFLFDNTFKPPTSNCSSGPTTNTNTAIRDATTFSTANQNTFLFDNTFKPPTSNCSSGPTTNTNTAIRDATTFGKANQNTFLFDNTFKPPTSNCSFGPTTNTNTAIRDATTFSTANQNTCLFDNTFKPPTSNCSSGPTTNTNTAIRDATTFGKANQNTFLFDNTFRPPTSNCSFGPTTNTNTAIRDATTFGKANQNTFLFDNTLRPPTSNCSFGPTTNTNTAIRDATTFGKANQNTCLFDNAFKPPTSNCSFGPTTNTNTSLGSGSSMFGSTANKSTAPFGATNTGSGVFGTSVFNTAFSTSSNTGLGMNMPQESLLEGSTFSTSSSQQPAANPLNQHLLALDSMPFGYNPLFKNLLLTELLTSLRSITSSLHKVLECPVCLGTIKVPFMECVRGHLMCSGCIKTLIACPSCQGDFSIENPVGVKNLLEALPRFCRFSDKGCKFVVEQNNDHEGLCGFRPVACRYSGCQVVVSVFEILKHYESDHPKHFIAKKLNHSITWTNFRPENNRIDNFPVHLFENLFWIVGKNDVKEKQLKIKFHAIPNYCKLLHDYFVRVTFEKEDYVYTCTIQASISSSIKCGEKKEENEDDQKKCEETNDNDESENGDDVDGYVMRIPQQTLRHFIDEKGELKCKLCFFRKEIK